MYCNISSKVFFVLIISITLLSCSKDNKEKTVLDYYFQGMDAYQKKDYSLFLKNLKKAKRLAPNNPNIIYNLARAYALEGNKKAAIECLRKVVRVGYYPNPQQNDDFDSLMDSQAFKAIHKEIRKMKISVNNSKIAFKIPEKDLMPEGIAYDPVKEIFYLGSLYKRKIISIANDGTMEDFAPEMQDGLWGIIGMKVDASRRILWVNSAALYMMKANEEKHYGFTGVFKYDLENGKLIKKYVLDERPILHLFNDLVVSSRGDVFITDSLFGAVYQISHEKDELELFVKPDLFTYPNGITLSQDEQYLYVAHGEGTSAINIDTRSFSILSHPQDMTLNGIDGLYFYKNSLIAIQNDNWQKRVIQFFLNENIDEAEGLNFIQLIKKSLLPRNKKSYQVEGASIIESGNPLFAFPTTGVLVGDTFYYIANSQLNHLKHDGTVSRVDKLHDILILKVRL